MPTLTVQFYVSSLAQESKASKYEVHSRTVENFAEAEVLMEDTVEGYGWADDGFIRTLNFRIFQTSKPNGNDFIRRYYFNESTRSFFVLF